LRELQYAKVLLYITLGLSWSIELLVLIYFSYAELDQKLNATGVILSGANDKLAFSTVFFSV
jgi:hypothetical protein